MLGAVLCSATLGMAQTSGPILSYTFNEVAVNPAYIGAYEGFTAGLNARKQSLNVEGAPSAQRMNIAMPLGNTKGSVGLLLNNNSFGVTSQLDVMAQYSYKLQLSNGSLYFGLQGGGESLKESNEDLLIKDQETTGLFANTSRAFAFNAGFGMYYDGDKYYIGLSAPQFFYNSFKGNEVTSQLFDKNMFRTYLAAGYTFATSQGMKLRPSGLVCYQASGSVNAEGVLTALFMDDTFWIGALYRTSQEAGLNIGFKIQKLIGLNYSFGAGTGELSQQAGTTHELGLRLSIPAKKN
ncbi:type IX secretion system membrane protein PorP/SprF [Pedobacter sp. HMF7647]|uniref:Type IX secretion system membrane protein PorP/SprF n=2 Tax=Hufsiella arboris TaxID=2695275 RepID=A0A7K1YCQ1_9SPHI|nr:type IX secretion system membrane protein PorP/SprF [Hufsiella arboris]